MQKIYIIKHKYYHSDQKKRKKRCSSMRPLFHYCSHYFSFSLFNSTSFIQTLCLDVIVIFHQLNPNQYKHKTFIRNRLKFLMSLLFSLFIRVLCIEACQAFLNNIIYDIHPQVYSHYIEYRIFCAFQFLVFKSPSYFRQTCIIGSEFKIWF